MRIKAVVKLIGALLVLFSATLAPPMAVSWWFADGEIAPFLLALCVNLALGAACWLPLRNHRAELGLREGVLVVVLFWTVLSLMAALPLLFMRVPAIDAIDALFEAMSGLTTTGATTLTGLDHLPPSILYYRQQLQWLGGMGIIVLAVAVMPMLGVGGMQLYRAETPGPVKHNKLTPRITETAKGLWLIYLGLTVLCAAMYYLAGMSAFDAVSHAFSTIAIGGFSTHDASLAYFNSNAVNLIAVVFMLLAGLNFALHFTALRARNPLTYFRDSEARAYFVVLFAVCMVCLATLLVHHRIDLSFDAELIRAVTQVVSVATTAGFVVTDFSMWPAFLPVMLILISCAGGCAGSTAGGMKIIRMVLLYKQGAREISKLVHPNALIPIKLGGRAVPDNVINAVWGFLSLYLFSYVVLLLLLLATGIDAVTAFSAVTACLNNLGPGLGEVAHNYASINPFGKGVLMFAMLLGRLELFTLLVLLSPVFWRS